MHKNLCEMIYTWFWWIMWCRWMIGIMWMRWMMWIVWMMSRMWMRWIMWTRWIMWIICIRWIICIMRIFFFYVNIFGDEYMVIFSKWWYWCNLMIMVMENDVRNSRMINVVDLWKYVYVLCEILLYYTWIRSFLMLNVNLSLSCC